MLMHEVLHPSLQLVEYMTPNRLDLILTPITFHHLLLPPSINLLGL